MSYILDALKKADAERERGTVPGLHSQALGQIDDEDGASRQALNPAVWIGAGVGICLIVVMGWQLWMREPAPAAAPPAPPSAAEMAQPAPPPQRAPEMGRNAVPYPPPPAPPSPDEVPARTATSRPAPPMMAANKSTTAQAPANARVPGINELPEDVRRDLPQLVIGGAMYSDTPSSRMLIINSQVFHEGDQPYQGLVLEEIRLKSAVFKYRGYRYAINY